MDLMIKVLTVTLPIVTAVLGFIGGLLRRSPYRGVEKALDVRRQFVEAGADPKVWDRMLAAELRDADSPQVRSYLRFARFWLIMILVTAVAVYTLLTLDPGPRWASEWQKVPRLTYAIVFGMEGLVALGFFGTAMRSVFSRRNLPYVAWAGLPPDSPEFDFSPAKPLGVSAAASRVRRRNWLWRTKRSGRGA